MPDYSKGKIYTIRCRNNDTLIYVGSTTQSLAKRFGGHKTNSLKQPDRLIYQTINNDWENWYIELYEEYSCENREQLCKKEGEIIRLVGTLNGRIEGRTDKEYRIDNIEKIKKIKRQPFECECGGSCWVKSKSRHFKTKKHLNYLQNQEK